MIRLWLAAPQYSSRRMTDMVKQRTLKTLVRTVGIGVHSGSKVELVMRPAAADSGIVFRRVDLDPPVELPAGVDTVGDTRMASTLVKGDVRVGTVEHLMSALAGLGIDNAYIDVDGPEIPIMDGSAASFVFLLQSAGIEEINAPKRFIRVLKPVEVRSGSGHDEKWARLDPYEGFKLRFMIDFDHPAINATAQDVEVDFARDDYAVTVARARTFGFVNEVEAMRAAGLGLGGNFQNVIVMDEYRVLNADGLRSGDEFAKHKILDAIGDLYQLGKPLIGAFSSNKGGHALNNQLLRALLADATAYEVATFEDIARAPAGVLHKAFA